MTFKFRLRIPASEINKEVRVISRITGVLRTPFIRLNAVSLWNEKYCTDDEGP